MAIYRFSMKHGSRAKGTCSGAHCRYILREERYNYGAHELRHTEFGNMPKWAVTAQYFWDKADLFEANNARLYTEFEITFPRELTSQQQQKLAQEFIKNEIGNRHPYTMAIHESVAQDGGKNPHMHLMFSTRTMDGIERDEHQFFKRANFRNPDQGGAPKDRSWIPKSRLEELRQSWEQHANLALKTAGHSATIDSRTLEVQGIDRGPEPKLSPFEAMLWRQGVESARTEDILILREIAKIQREQGALEKAADVLSKIAYTRSLEERARVILMSQQECIERLITRRETADRTVDALTEELSGLAKTEREAFIEARTRVYGRAMGEHAAAIEQAKEVLNKALSRLENNGGAIRDVRELWSDIQGWLRARGELADARLALKQFSENVKSPEVEKKCQELAKQLLNVRTETVAKRDRALDTALTTRNQIEQHEAIAAELEGMIASLQSDCSTEQQQLPIVVQQMIELEERAIKIGQEKGAARQQVTQELEQKLSLEFSNSG